MSKYFFSYIEDIPEALHNTPLCVQHLLALSMVLCLWIILTLIFKDKNRVRKWRFIAIISLLLPLLEVAQMLWYKSIGQFSLGYTLPLHLCSLMCVLLPIMAFTRNGLLMEYSYAMGLAPAMMTLITPDVYYYPAFSFIYIQTMLVHGIICFIPIFLIFGMDFKPDIRMLPKVIGMLVGLSILIIPVNYFTNGNYFFLRYPASGSPMELFADLVGSPWYLMLTLLLGCVLWAALYSPFIIIRQRNKYKQLDAEYEEIEKKQPVLVNK
ncbi:MAG: YwaF family protein [Ruminiclostridium sp.]